MKIADYHYGFLGFGHMAQIIFSALDRAKLINPAQTLFHRRDPHKIRANQETFGITSTSLETLIAKSDVIFLCIRPNQLDQVLPHLKGMASSKIVITVLAGVKLAHYSKYLPNHSILRVMPNVASEVGMGMSLISASPDCSKEALSLTHILFAAMGEVMDMDEMHMDISCAIAGSGPGFVFRLIEAMAQEGTKKGLPHAQALKMAAQVFMGAAKLVLKKGEVLPLLTQIATPNGTTEAGLHKMEELHVAENLQSVIAASCHRSQELSQ